MKEIRVEYKPKNPSNEKEREARIVNVLPGCEDCGSEMRFVGSPSCIHEDWRTFLYQCPSCKRIDLEDSFFGHSSLGIDEPASKWERV